MLFLSDSELYTSNKLLNANPAYLGWILIIYAVFNSSFIISFFKNAYNIGIPFLKFSIITSLMIILCEVLHNIPGFESLNDTHLQFSQFYIFISGLIIYPTVTFISLKLSINRFEKTDL